MEKITASFAAGENKIFQIKGQYFEVVTAAGDLTVLLDTAQGQRISTLKNIGESSFVKPRKEFAHISIVSATAQTIEFLVGEGDAGSRRFSGKVSVTGVNINTGALAVNTNSTKVSSANLTAEFADYTLFGSIVPNLSEIGFVGIVNGGSTAILVKEFNYSGYPMFPAVGALPVARFDLVIAGNALNSAGSGFIGLSKNTNIALDGARYGSNYTTTSSAGLQMLSPIKIIRNVTLENTYKGYKFDKPIVLNPGQVLYVGNNSWECRSTLSVDFVYEIV